MASDERVWVGLDVGTQGVRALAVRADGKVMGSGSRPLHSRRDAARHEQDSEQWWTALADAARAALAGIAPERIQGVAADATSGTVLLVGGAGEPLTPGLMYDDARATEQARHADAAARPVWAAMGHRMHASWALPKLLWLLEEHPGLVREARLAHQVDVVTRRLVGHETPTDSSHALKTGYDLRSREWPHTALEALGVPDGMMPRVVAPGAVLGEVCAQAAHDTGLPSGTRVFAGMTDGCAAQLASGALREGDVNAALGTTLVLKGVSSEHVPDPAGIVYSHRGRDGEWLPGGASSSGAGALTIAFPHGDLPELDRRAAEHEDTGVLAYPLLGRGERFPFAAADAEPFLLGRPSDDAEHHAALLHGVAFVERLCFDAMDLLGVRTDGAITLTGGATSSRRFNQVRCDVLGRPVRLVACADSAFGMAVLAAAASTARPVAEVAADMVHAHETLAPRPGRRDHLLESYRRLVGELETRGWLPGALAEHARARAA